MLTAAKTPSFSEVDVLQRPGPEGGTGKYGFEEVIGFVIWIPNVASVAGFGNGCTVQFHGRSAGIHWDTHTTSLAMVTPTQLSLPYASSPQVLLTQPKSFRGSFPYVHPSRHGSSPLQNLVVFKSDFSEMEDDRNRFRSSRQASLQEGRLSIESRGFSFR
jgi:hypothetical protein